MNNNLKTINALIVDDEIDACKNIQVFLQQCSVCEVNIIGMAQNTVDAERILSQFIPDVVFLDIEMPNENAFQLLSRLGQQPFEVIFVTAYEDYAIRALKLNALDYILKPISAEELNLAMQKLIEKRNDRKSGKVVLSHFLDQISNKNSKNSIVLRDKAEFLIVEINKILFVEAENSYARFHFYDSGNTRMILMSHPLSYYQEILPTEMFFRAHKSYLVNYNHIKKMLKDENSSLVLKNDYVIPLSRRRFQLLVDFLIKKNVSIKE